MSLIRRRRKVLTDNMREHTGIAFDTDVDIKGNHSKDIWMYVLNGILTSCIIISTIGTFASSFDIPYNELLLVIATTVICITISFVYYNRIIKWAVYVICILGFTFGSREYYRVVNSGFSSILNEIMEYVEKAMDLPVEKRYVELYSDSMVSVTAFFLMFAITYAFMINIIVSEFKRILSLLLITFPIVQIGMYFDMQPNMFYFGLYIAALLVIFFLEMVGKFNVEKNEKTICKGRKGTQLYSYVRNGRINISIALRLALFFAVMIVLIGFLYPKERYLYKEPVTDWKAQTESTVRRMVLVGFWGMLSDGQIGYGGVAGGNLGQVGEVRLSYERNLIVRTARTESENTLYLKGYIGSFYGGNKWMTISEYLDEHEQNAETKDDVWQYRDLEDYGLSNNISYYLISKYLEHDSENGNIYANDFKRMYIQNINASKRYYYLPYGMYNSLQTSTFLFDNTNLLDDKIDIPSDSGFEKGQRFYFSYSPLKIDNIYSNWNRLDKENTSNDLSYWRNMEETYRKYVYNTYLDVPDQNRQVIEEICEANGLTSDNDNLITDMRRYFHENFTYTLIPGKTPRDKDFVNYFLEETKKGYCTYFASSAVLMFRTLGIPARYVGGYAAGPDDVNNATIIEKDDYWSEPNYREDAEYIEIELLDSNAHAWAEIYIDGLGWVPVEMTPPSYEEIPDPIDNQGGALNFLANTIFSDQTMAGVRRGAVGMAYMAAFGVVMFILGYSIIGMIVRVRRNKSFQTEDRNTNVLKGYQYMCRCFEFMHCPHENGMSYSEYGDQLVQRGYFSDDDIEKIMHIVEKGYFSPYGIAEEESMYVMESIQRAVQEAYNQMPFYKRFIFRAVKWL